jgi:hypothetical protein
VLGTHNELFTNYLLLNLWIGVLGTCKRGKKMICDNQGQSKKFLWVGANGQKNFFDRGQVS